MTKNENSITDYYDEKKELKEDKINLGQIKSAIWNNKFKIIFISIIITSLSIIKILSKPETYESITILAPQNPPKLSFVGALGTISVVDMSSSGNSGDSKLDPAVSMDIILNDFKFEEYMIKKYNLPKLLVPKRENFVFPFNYDGVYNYITKLKQKIKTKIKPKKMKKPMSHARLVISVTEKIKRMLTIKKDSNPGFITMKVISKDRFLAKKLLDIYLKELTAKMREIEMKNVDKQMKYYKKKLKTTMNIFMKKQFMNLISGLVQKKVLSLANPLYNVFQITKPRVPYKDEKPKSKAKGQIIVSFIVSLILGIGISFLLEMRKTAKNKNKETP